MNVHESSASNLVEVRDIDGQGRGYFLRENVNTASGGGLIRNHTGLSEGVSAGTTVLKGCKPTVAAIHDSHETRNCRNCLQPTEDTAAGTYALGSTNSDDWLPCFRERAFSCQVCQRSVLCTTCYAAAVPSAGTITAAHDYGTTAGPDPGHRAEALSHDRLECEALANLSTLQREQPNLAGSLLGGNTVYLRLLLQLLALRAQQPGARALGRGRGTPQAAQASVRERLSAVEELEDQLDDMLGCAELEARVGNTVAAAKMVAPAVWKASQDDCARFLGKLYCNSMTIGRAGVSASLARRGYWSGVRGCLYSEFGVGLFPEGAMFNHSCAPNCAWRTDESGLLRVVAVREISGGEQLCISYIDVLQPKQVRRDLLREHYFFNCACLRCSNTVASSSFRLHEPPTAARSHSNAEYANGFGERDEAADEDLVAGGWVCPKRACCGQGRLLRPSGGCPNDHDISSDDSSDHGPHGQTPVPENQQGSTALNALAEGSRCRSCGGVTEEAYFDRWEGMFRARIMAADADLGNGRVREGRRKLSHLQILCGRRLVSTHAFTLGVLCRLVVAAAIDQDWTAVVCYAESALLCMQGLRRGVMTSCSVAGGGGGEGRVDAPPAALVVGATEDPTQATAIWEAVLVETLERAVLLVGRQLNLSPSSCRERTEWRERTLALAERAAVVSGLQLVELVDF